MFAFTSASCIIRGFDAISDGKFLEVFTGGKFPETFPTMFAHRFLVAYFLTVLSTLPSFYDVTLHYL
jgi:hypothetical protein